MKINIISDVHHEINHDFMRTTKFAPADILVLAGDIFSAAELNPFQNHYSAVQVQDAVKRYKQDVFPNFKKVFMVMGNHEYYNVRK